MTGEPGLGDGLLVAVVADRLNRAALEGLGALGDLLVGHRLLRDEGVATLLMPGKEICSSLAAKVA